jgi:putative YphP/YqiW family bacilliredoxin
MLFRQKMGKSKDIFSGWVEKPAFYAEQYRVEQRKHCVVHSNFFSNFALYTIIKTKQMYPEQIVTPMKEELTDNGFSELLTAEEVESQLHEKGTTLVMINSVCGCSAGSARPGVLMAVANSPKKPDHLATTFAGFDIEAVNKIREHLLPYPPSSPAIALFKDGQLVHMIERHQIEGRPAQIIAHNLIATFNEYC